MYVQSKKVAQWSGKDYFKVILCFFINYIVLGVLCAVATFANKNFNWAQFSQYFISPAGLRDYIFLMLALFLIMLVIFLFY